MKNSNTEININERKEQRVDKAYKENLTLKGNKTLGKDRFLQENKSVKEDRFLKENQPVKEDPILPYQLFLASVDGIGARTISKLLNRFPGGAREIWEASEADIRACIELSERQKDAFLAAKRKWNPDKMLKTIDAKQIRIVTLEHAEYPMKLRSIPDPPYLLYYYGELPSETLPSVAVIGARMCSDYGRKMAEEFAGDLAKEGVQIISGLASGIDGIAQRAAVAENGKSYGILGCGVDYCYPASNRTLYEALKEKGGLISEFPPGEKPLADHFPRRNRIISGLADIVLVIEAKERSGTAITVQMALEQGREVFAIPGRNIDMLSRGCNRLIRDGAGIALEVRDIITSLSLMGYPMSFGVKVKANQIPAIGQNEETRNNSLSGKVQEKNGDCHIQDQSLKVRICQLIRENNYMEQQLFDILLKEMKSASSENTMRNHKNILNNNSDNKLLTIQDLKCIVTELEIEDCIINHGGVLSWKY